MWTYSRGYLIHHHRSLLSSLSNHCVQRQRRSSTIGELTVARLNLPNLNATRTLSATSVLAGRHCVKGFRSFANCRIAHQSHNLEVHGKEELPSSVESLADVNDEELERQRDIWNVGPAFRPSFNLAPFVNESAVLQEFLRMGVELHRWDRQKPDLLKHILTLDFDKDVAPYVR